jgi:hypothetical protein
MRLDPHIDQTTLTLSPLLPPRAVPTLVCYPTRSTTHQAPQGVEEIP